MQRYSRPVRSREFCLVGAPTACMTLSPYARAVGRLCIFRYSFGGVRFLVPLCSVAHAGRARVHSRPTSTYLPILHVSTDSLRRACCTAYNYNEMRSALAIFPYSLTWSTRFMSETRLLRYYHTRHIPHRQTEMSMANTQGGSVLGRVYPFDRSSTASWA